MKKFLALLLSLLMLLSLCACGAASKNAASSSRGDYARAPMPEPEAPMEMPAAADEGYWDGEADYGGLSMADGAGSEPASAPEEKPDTQTVDPEKIIYSADATVETTEFEQTLERLQALVAQFGGFIESSSINGSNYYSQSRGYANSRSANFCIRIPSQRFQELMSSLSSLGNVPYTYTYSENITARYYDVQARLTAYQTQEQRLLEMMKLAETVSDIIEIEDRLTELRYEIESLQSTLNNWDRQVSYSSVNVTVSEVTIYTPEANLSYGQQLSLAVKNGLQSVGDFFSDFLLVLLEALPALIVLAVFVVVVVLVVRACVKKSRQKKMLRWQQSQQTRQEQAVKAPEEK